MDEFTNKSIFDSLGMHHTFFRTTANDDVMNRSIGYVVQDDGSFDHYGVNQVMYGAGSMGSTIEDLAKWSEVLNGRNAAYIELTAFLSTTETLARFIW